MQVSQFRCSPDAPPACPDGADTAADLVLAFGSSANVAGAAARHAWFAGLGHRFPRAARVYCSTAGQIAGTAIHDDAVTVTVVRFAHTRVLAASVVHAPDEPSESVGARLAAALPAGGLRHVLVLADGISVNGSALVRGLAAALPPDVTLTGGLASDDARFHETVVGLDGPPAPGTTVVVGFYGDRLVVGAAAVGGWERFGPDRLVTRSVGNVLYELDGEPALALYKRYLGPFAAELPASGLLFPLAFRTMHAETGVVRSVLGVDEAAGSVRFAGDVPEGSYVRLMKGNNDRLIDAAGTAAERALGQVAPSVDAGGDGGAGGGDGDRLALLISCIGRRLVLGQRAEEELEAAGSALGAGAVLSGFYSYGEIAPTAEGPGAGLHNQTMTVTLLGER